MTAALQERFATEAHMTAAGAPAEAVAAELAKRDALVALVRGGADFETVRAAAGGTIKARVTQQSSISSVAGSITIPTPPSSGSRVHCSRSSAARISSRR